ncbi:MAG: GGDEF domain-containing protein [Pseudomonadales bacterium]
MQIFPRSTLAFLAPYLLLIIGYCALDLFNNLSINQLATLRLIPYSLFVVSACISLYFGRNRIFYLSLLMALLHWALTSYHPYIDVVQQQNLLMVLGILAPLNLAVLSLFRDRGLTWVQSYLMTSVLGLQSALVFEVMNNDRYEWLQRLEQLFDSLPLSELSLVLPNAVLISLLMSAAIISVRLFFRNTPLNNALLAVLVTLGITFNFVDVTTTASVLLVVAGLVALLCLLQHSYDMAYRDELTGLLGRRALNERLLRLSGRYCIVMVDVDFFKKFNDTHGHDVGDQVLKMLAGQLDRTGGGARAYRYGGEEFVLVFESKTLAQIEPVIEKLRADVADYPMKVRGFNRPIDSNSSKKLRKKGDGSKTLAVTISLGAAQRNERLKTTRVVMEAADKALYRAKNAGRNQVKLHK